MPAIVLDESDPPAEPVTLVSEPIIQPIFACGHLFWLILTNKVAHLPVITATFYSHHARIRLGIDVADRLRRFISQYYHFSDHGLFKIVRSSFGRHCIVLDDSSCLDQLWRAFHRAITSLAHPLYHLPADSEMMYPHFNYRPANDDCWLLEDAIHARCRFYYYFSVNELRALGTPDFSLPTKEDEDQPIGEMSVCEPLPPVVLPRELLFIFAADGSLSSQGQESTEGSSTHQSPLSVVLERSSNEENPPDVGSGQVVTRSRNRRLLSYKRA